MESAAKRLKFRDEQGNEFEVEQLLGLPTNVAVKVLLGLENIFELYNFANVSKATRQFMENNKVYERWDEVYFGPIKKVRQLAAFLLKLPPRGTIFYLTNTMTINILVRYSNWEEIVNHFENNTTPMFGLVIQFNNEEFVSVFEKRFPKITETARKNNRIGIKIGSLRDLAGTAYKLAELLLSFGDYAGLVTNYNTSNDILALHTSISCALDAQSSITFRTSDGRTLTIHNNYFEMHMTVLQLLNAGHRLFFSASPKNVNFINNCFICTRPASTKCSKCQQPIHDTCWDYGHTCK